ncbi:hypothetical protein GBO89_07560 [Pediococcus pentosaceus]|nr:hypothetical protein GBO89_07560 [Pediococcus pentosaceus]
MVNTILKEADLFCPNSVRINFTIYQSFKIIQALIRHKNYIKLTVFMLAFSKVVKELVSMIKEG